MGHLEQGKWVPDHLITSEKGHFVRATTTFRDHISADGSSGFPAEAGRYHLYVAAACPWAHRTMIVRRLKQLDGAISLSVAEPHMGEDGWRFNDESGDGQGHLLRDTYLAARSDYTGRTSVPVLWDKQRRTIVNNESREILRMLDHEMNAFGDATLDLCPPDLAEQVDREIDANYNPINNGVYRAGFAQTQEAHEQAVGELFSALDRCEQILDKQRYLCGDRLTEADLCLFTTLVRFDPIYHYLFKCNVRRLRDYDNLWNYTRDLAQTPGIRETVDIASFKEHYFWSMESLNPRRIVPLGPTIDYNEPHDRGRFS